MEPGPAFFDRTTMAPMGCVPGDFNEDGLRRFIGIVDHDGVFRRPEW